MKPALMDMFELYYINDIRRPRNQTGVRLSKEARKQLAAERALERFICRMQIIILNILVKRRPLK